MQLALQIAAYVIGLPLGLMIMAVLLRGQWKQYPFVFAYVLGDFLTSVLEIQPGLQYEGATPQAKQSFALLYWWDERVMQVLEFLLVIGFIYRAAAHLKTRHILLLGVVCGILLFAGITLLIYYTPGIATGRWITPWLRNLNFCAAILDLGLWALLIGAKRKDFRLLMVSGALGIQFTGGAIGQAVRQLSHSSVQVTGYFISLSNLVCLYIFWQAFRTPSPPADPRTAAQPPLGQIHWEKKKKLLPRGRVVFLGRFFRRSSLFFPRLYLPGGPIPGLQSRRKRSSSR